jgi:uncharacterized protein YceK
MKKLIVIALAFVLFLSACNSVTSKYDNNPICITQYSGGKIVNQYNTTLGSLDLSGSGVGIIGKGVTLYGDLKVEVGQCRCTGDACLWLSQP